MENENVKIEAPKINFNLSVPVKFDSRFLEGNANQLNLGFDYWPLYGWVSDIVLYFDGVLIFLIIVAEGNVSFVVPFWWICWVRESLCEPNST